MIKKVTITLAVLWNSIFLSPTSSIQAQSNFTLTDGTGRQTTNLSTVYSNTREALEDNQLNHDPSILSTQERAGMLDNTVEFYYFTCTGYNAMHASLGTKIDKHTILTHNHFGKQANFCMIDPVDPSHPHDVAIKTAGMAMGHRDGYGNQTQLIHIAKEIEGPYAHIASQQEIGELEMGDFVEVVYRDDSSSALAIASLQIRGF